MNKRKRILAGAAIVAALALGTTLPAIAQNDDTDTTTEQDGVSREERQAARAGEFAAALAAELDLDTDTVGDALAKVHDDLVAERAAAQRAALEERLSTAVEDGELTQEQADAILEAHDAGVLRGFGDRGRHGGHGGFMGGPPGGRARFRARTPAVEGSSI